MMVALSVHTSLSPVSSIKRFLKSQSSPVSSPASSCSSGPSDSSSSPSSTTAQKPRLPTHLLYEIGRYSDLPRVLYLSLCSHRVHALLAPLLYASIELKTNRQCKTALIALSKRPPAELAPHIRRLVVRPNNPEWALGSDSAAPTAELDEQDVALLVAGLARKGALKALQTFEWDGREMPGAEMWEALRTSCRCLKRISTSIGEEPLDASSPLWDFNDLRQLGLTVKCHSLDWLADGIPHQKTSKLPRKFWVMLLERSPRLESLTLGGPAPAPRIFDIRHVTAGRWPRLREVTLGDTAVLGVQGMTRRESRGESDREGNAKDNKNASGAKDRDGSEAQIQCDRAAFMAFFAAHPGLKSIKLLHAAGGAYFPSGWSFPLPPPTSYHHGHNPSLPAPPLPALEEFTAPLKWVRTLPQPTRRGLRKLTLTGLGLGVGTGGAAGVRMAVGVLNEMGREGRLEALGLWGDLGAGFAFGGLGYGGGGGGGGGSLGYAGRRMSLGGEDNPGGRYDDVYVLGALLDAVPRLRELEVACFTRSGFAIRDFAPLLQHLPLLRSFSLTKVHKSGDEDLLRGAVRIVQANASGTLRKAVLRETQEMWFSAGGGRVRALGVYEVLDWGGGGGGGDRDGGGGGEVGEVGEGKERQRERERTMVVNEWGQRSRSLTGGVKEYRRSCVHPLPPPLPVPVQVPLSAPATLPADSGKMHRRRLSLTSVFERRSQSPGGVAAAAQAQVQFGRSSPRSSISSSGGASVTWADATGPGLVRNGSGASGGGSSVGHGYARGYYAQSYGHGYASSSAGHGYGGSGYAASSSADRRGTGSADGTVVFENCLLVN